MAKKTQTEQVMEQPTETPAETPREVVTRRKETRPSNEVFREKAGNRLRLFEYQVDALVQQCRGRVARPSQEQFQWLTGYLRNTIEAAITAIGVELSKEDEAPASERKNVPVPL